MARNTRKRILVASLLLFNEKGEPRTTINDVADEIDISPGNLHYHFRKKSEIVDALLAEFQADARKVLQPPESDSISLDEFWVFLHLLLELSAAYRFLLRDTESLVETYPKVANALRQFAKGLTAVFELYLRALAAGGALEIDDDGSRVLAGNLAVIALFSDRFDALVHKPLSADDAALRVARSILNALGPFATGTAATQLEELATHYKE